MLLIQYIPIYLYLEAFLYPYACCSVRDNTEMRAIKEGMCKRKIIPLSDETIDENELNILDIANEQVHQNPVITTPLYATPRL